MKKGQVTKKVQARRRLARKLAEFLKEEFIAEKVFKNK